MLDQLQDCVNSDPVLRRIGRQMTAQMLIGIGRSEWLVEIDRGHIREIRPGPHLMQSQDFSIRFSDKGWREFMKPIPRPGYHDLFAMTKTGEAVIEGNLTPLMANLRFVKEVLGSLRTPGRNPS